MIPPVEERQIRPCGFSQEIGDVCIWFLLAIEHVGIKHCERPSLHDITPCKYHITRDELLELTKIHNAGTGSKQQLIEQLKDLGAEIHKIEDGQQFSIDINYNTVDYTTRMPQSTVLVIDDDLPPVPMKCPICGEIFVNREIYNSYHHLLKLNNQLKKMMGGTPFISDPHPLTCECGEELQEIEK